MTFATEKIKVASVKNFLVRLSPARHISNLLASGGGGIYTYTFSNKITGVQRNGSDLTETASNPPTLDDTWNYDQTTGILKVKLAAAPDDETNVVVLFYRLHFSSQYVDTTSDPLDSSSDSVEWKDWIRDTPTIRNAFIDQAYGVLSTQASNIGIINPDRYFQELLTTEDSFYRKTCEIWIAVNDQFIKVFSGPIESLNLSSRGRVTIGLRDASSPLDRLAFMGDTQADAYLQPVARTPGKYEYQPIPYIFGKSRYNLSNDSFNAGASAYTGFRNLDIQRMGRAAFSASPSFILDGTDNRGPWYCCRTSADGFKALSFGTVSEISITDNTTFTFQDHGQARPLMRLTITDDHNLEVGDSFRWTHASWHAGQNQYALVVQVARDSNFVFCMLMSSIGNAFTTTLSSGFTFFSNSSPGLMLFDRRSSSNPYVLLDGIDFTTTIDTLASGNKRMRISLVNNFESATNVSAQPYHSGLQNVDASHTEIYFRATQTASGSPNKHGTALQEIITKAGISVDASSFSDANAALDVYTSFSIPAVGENTYQSYRSYCQRIAKSTLGYLTFNEDQEAVYQLLDSPAAGGDLVNDDISSSHSTSIKYSDIISEIITKNEHLPKTDTSYTSAKARYLHGGDAKIEYEHVLEDISPRANDILSFRATPFVGHKFSGPFAFVDKVLGTDFEATLEELLGAASTQDIKAVAITISGKGVEIEASPIQGLS